MPKSLTIWIPTYRRSRQLDALLANLQQCGLTTLAEVIVSDNDPDGALAQAISRQEQPLPPGVHYRCNPANLSAGVNFLRAFECCHTPWLMIVGDDDLFATSAAADLEALIANVSPSVLAVKFDSSLFGQQPLCHAGGLQGYVDQLPPEHYPEAFNNLCLVSNWLFRCGPYRRHLASAYLGYSSKLSHLFPVLRACARDGGQLLFSPLQPVLHGTTEGSSWPKAATWYEMAMTLSTFCGFVDRADRVALQRLLFHSDWRRNVAKCLRVHQFYGDRRQGVSSWQIHGHLALMSGGYRLALLLALPLLLLPAARLPRRLLQQLGDPGSVERW
jgi:glycosyltransferase involved in cell wall biosynthesis